jgi:hypothetical protein
LEAFPEGVVVWPVLPGHALIDDGGHGRLRRVSIGEGASSEQWNPHDAEIFPAHKRVVGPVELVRGAAIDHKSDLALVGKRHMSGYGYRCYNRQRGEPRYDAALDLMAPLGRSIALSIECSPENQRMFGVKTKWDLKYAKEASEEQARPDQQDNGARDLSENQQARKPALTSTRSGLPG